MKEVGLANILNISGKNSKSLKGEGTVLLEGLNRKAPSEFDMLLDQDLLKENVQSNDIAKLLEALAHDGEGKLSLKDTNQLAKILQQNDTISKLTGDEVSFDGKNFVDHEGRTLSLDKLKVIFSKIEQSNIHQTEVKKLNIPLEKSFGNIKNTEAKIVQSGHDYTKAMEVAKNTNQRAGIPKGEGVEIAKGQEHFIHEDNVLPMKRKKSNGYNRSKIEVNTGSFFSKSKMIENPVQNKEKMENGQSFSDSQKNEFQNVINLSEVENTKLSTKVESLNLGAKDVIDLSNIKVSNNNQLISKLSDYIEQNAIANRNELDVLVKHDELGDFRISAQKVGKQGHIDLKIITGGAESQQFFAQNETEIIKNLTQSGVKLVNVKIVSAGTEVINTSNEGKGHFDQGSSDEKKNQLFGQQQGHQRQNENQDSRKRRQLWEQYKEQASA
jgi:hypothetical protein